MCLFIAGVINFIPSALAVVPGKISIAYGIQIPDSNYELLLRHRAILFGIVGGMMIYSALTKKYYSVSVVMGLVSMISFLILSQLISGDINPELQKVKTIDIIGIVILLLGYFAFKFKK